MPTFMNNTKQNYTGKSISRQDTNTAINLDTGVVIDPSTSEILEQAGRLPKILPEGRVLYNCHISLASIRFPKKFSCHGLTYSVGGSAVRLEATNVPPTEGENTNLDSHLADQDLADQDLVVKPKLEPTSKPPKRAEIKTFSFRSRRRLLLGFAKLNKTKLKKPKMLTLTYPSSYSDQWERWKRDLDVFVSKHLLVKLPNVFVMWKLEPQKRGAPHYHLLIFSDCSNTLEQVYQLKDEWKRVWFNIVGSGDPNHLKVGTWVGFNSNQGKRKTNFTDWKEVSGYVSKYLGKTHEGFKDHLGNPINFTGRYWGIYNRKMYNSFVDEQELDLDFEKFHQLKEELVKNVVEDMESTVQMHRFRMTKQNWSELETVKDKFDYQYNKLVADSSITEGEITIEIPDCYHFKRSLNLHRQRRSYQTRLTDSYGLFAFIESSKVVEACKRIGFEGLPG